jgi:DNA-binding beta-propeller fold protein YncE
MSVSRLMQMGAAGYVPSGPVWTDPDIANASYDSVSVSVLTETFASTDLFFKPDGTKVYITDNGPDEINEYNLTTAWDLSTLSYVQNFSCSSQDVSIGGTFFKPDGTKMYVVGIIGVKVYEYNLSTAWDISTASFNQNFSVSTEEPAPRAIYFKPDGTKMFITGQTGDEINEYSLSTAWDVSTASASQVASVSSQETSPQGLFMSPNGDKLYIVGYDGDAVFQYSLTTAWDISTMSYDSISFSVSSQETLPTGIAFKPDGSKMYITGINTDAIYQYST